MNARRNILSVLLFPLFLIGGCDDFALNEKFIPEETALRLAIVPASVEVNVGGTVAFSATGGTPPYLYGKVSGDGEIESGTGVYTAPWFAGTVLIDVKDSAGGIAVAAVTVGTPSQLVLFPQTAAVRVGGTVAFSAFGGIGNHSYAIDEGAAGGEIDPLTGLYAAPPDHGGTFTVRVTDGSGPPGVAALVTVVPAAEVRIWPAGITVGTNATYQFAATGGVPPYAYSVYSGGGSVGPASGIYTAAGVAGSVFVRVTDSLGASSDSTVTVVIAGGALAISPEAVTVPENGTVVFAASGGVPPYEFSLASGSGTINRDTGLYTALGGVGVDAARVKVSDEASEKKETLVTIVPAAPKDLAADGVSPGNNSEILLTWNDRSSAEDGYTVERKVGVYGVWETVASLPAGTTVWSETGITSGDIHIYRVRATAGSLYSLWSDEAYDFAK